MRKKSPDHPRVAIVGRPNVGKSTLVNRLLGEERMIAFDQPGTTRDAIEVELDWHGKRYTLVDTAGIRRKGKVFESVEKFSVVKTLQAIERRTWWSWWWMPRPTSPSRMRTSAATSSRREGRWWSR
jgi:predicted GTPase